MKQVGEHIPSHTLTDDTPNTSTTGTKGDGIDLTVATAVEKLTISSKINLFLNVNLVILICVFISLYAVFH